LRLVFNIQLSVLSKEKERLGAALLEMTGAGDGGSEEAGGWHESAKSSKKQQKADP